ncbi:MAG: helix-turn-helix transcriptional regulator [Elusimicrobia bacterium]|nr:helix-turn-helix transcriptional regulator [Elusimicrobiota bacterium]
MKKSIYEIIGERTREERKKAGLTIERLAELARISPSFLAYIETKRRKASLETVQRLAEALHLPVSSLFAAESRQRGGDAVYSATQQFAQIIRGKSETETYGILEVAKAAARSIKDNKRRA